MPVSVVGRLPDLTVEIWILPSNSASDEEMTQMYSILFFQVRFSELSELS